jgi:hypothetical protein
LILALTGSTGKVGVFRQVTLNGTTEKFLVAVSQEELREAANVTDKMFHLGEDGFFTEVCQWIDELVPSLTVNEE